MRKKLKMSYFRFFVIILILVFINPITFAFYPQNWIKINSNDENPKIISLDVKSINEHNHSLYYAVEYYTPQNGMMVSIIQSKGYEVGIVENFTSVHYKKIMQDHISSPYPPLTPKVATKFNKLTTNSLLYNANILAMAISGYNGDVELGQADFTNYLKEMQQSIKRTWLFSWDYKNITNVGTGKVVLIIKVGKFGQLVKADIKTSSGSDQFDKSTLDIVKSCSKYFKDLPNDFTGNGIDIKIEFNYSKKQVITTLITPNVNVKN